MKKLLTAIAVVGAMSAGAAFAQNETAEMSEGLSMLEVAAAKQFNKIGVTDVDVMSLSLNQLAQIKAVFESSDYTVNEQEQQVRKIVAN